MSSPLTVAILAGGKSSRMGTDKSFVRAPWGAGRPLVEDVLAQVAGIGAETIVVTNRPDDYRYLGVSLFSDVLPDKGALGGIYTALHSSSQPCTLCVACDMPFVIRPLLAYLISLIPEGDAIVPRLNGEAEPFRAIYSRRRCLAPIRAALDAGQLRVISFSLTCACASWTSRRLTALTRSISRSSTSTRLRIWSRPGGWRLQHEADAC
jgi:molybdopterin-guanine dinucleotide biosynthesis protein A